MLIHEALTYLDHADWTTFTPIGYPVLNLHAVICCATFQGNVKRVRRKDFLGKDVPAEKRPNDYHDFDSATEYRRQTLQSLRICASQLTNFSKPSKRTSDFRCFVLTIFGTCWLAIGHAIVTFLV